MGGRGWNGELSSKQLDEHRRGVKEEEEEEEGQYKVHEGGESSKSSRRQRMAAQLTVRKHSPHHRAGAVHGSACVGWMLNDNKKNHH